MPSPHQLSAEAASTICPDSCGCVGETSGIALPEIGPVGRGRTPHSIPTGLLFVVLGSMAAANTAHAQRVYGLSDMLIDAAPSTERGQTDAKGGGVQELPELPEPGQAPGDAGDLAKQLSNPIASLISVPFQQNIDFGAGPTGDGVKMTLNIQPVVPISAAPKWNIIVRTILPVVYQSDISAQGANEFGLGDTVQSFFLSPKKAGPSGVIWGVGPILLYPTATSKFLGGEKWGAGPTAVVLKQSGKSTFGLLANHIWSVGGDDDRDDVSITFMQPFYSYTTASATTYSLNTETSYDWKRDNWLVPINLSVAQLTKMGRQPVQVGIAGRYYAEKPKGGPDWGMRLVLTLLYPRK